MKRELAEDLYKEPRTLPSYEKVGMVPLDEKTLKSYDYISSQAEKLIGGVKN